MTDPTSFRPASVPDESAAALDVPVMLSTISRAFRCLDGRLRRSELAELLTLLRQHVQVALPEVEAHHAAAWSGSPKCRDRKVHRDRVRALASPGSEPDGLLGLAVHVRMLARELAWLLAERPV